MKVAPYTSFCKTLWDQVVCESRNGTFLFLRDYMDYHHDRFVDNSLIAFDDKNVPIAVFPANRLDEEKLIISHGGLTYGSWLVSPKVTAIYTQELWEETIKYYRNNGIQKIQVKPVPHIYHTYPCEEQEYWLFRFGAKVVSRSLSSAINLTTPLSFSKLRNRKVRNAEKSNVEVILHAPLSYLVPFWNILSSVLSNYHHTKPVHTIDEISLLSNRFPENIQLSVVRKAKKIIGGCIQYKTALVNHIQYIAASEEGRNTGALDLLFKAIITDSERQGFQYVDFGISTEQGGKYLNEGLIFQKEGFGGRGICYDIYEIDLHD